MCPPLYDPCGVIGTLSLFFSIAIRHRRCGVLLGLRVCMYRYIFGFLQMTDSNHTAPWPSFGPCGFIVTCMCGSLNMCQALILFCLSIPFYRIGVFLNKLFRVFNVFNGTSVNKAAHSLTMMALLNFNYIDWDTTLNFLVDIVQFDACASDSSES
ncbi:hypothetical protein Gorai_007806 [Gossypium raimondii]|uniref:Uncharacterized protein n=1 Tax=Gossypium raimondii TaxID=29730 RepID=A0A7J8Q9T8_GOSRA|nr:hypothetical protein [Gossypium raimondii]